MDKLVAIQIEFQSYKTQKFLRWHQNPGLSVPIGDSWGSDIEAFFFLQGLVAKNRDGWLTVKAPFFFFCLMLAADVIRNSH